MYTVAPSSAHWHKEKRWRPRPYALETPSCPKINAFEKLSLNQEHGDGVLDHHQLRERSSWSSRANTGGAALTGQSYHLNLGPTAEPGVVHMALVLKEWQGH